jgi:ABC-type multidrug transport system ATPase subunit
MTIQLKSKIENLDGIKIKDSEVITIGRDKSNTISIDSTFLSANHVKLYLIDDNIFIEDLGSTNGTYIDGKKLENNKPYNINEKQKVILGSEEAIFEINKISSNMGTQVYKNKNIYTIGRLAHCDITIDATTVSSEHLKIEKNDDQWYIYDTNSTNGTFLNGLKEKNKITSTPLKKDEILYLGNYKLQTNKILDFLNKNSIKKSEKIQLSKTTTLGRDPKSDMHINHPSVSFHHAILHKTSSGYELEDLKSTNGTYVNGKQVKGKISINANDEIQVGIHSFILMLNNEKDATIVQKEFLDGFSIEAKNITIEVGNKIKLLDNISFTVNPGELVGLMGLSGAGKTTLIKALNGYDKPISGTSLINGNDLYENYNLVKSIIGYVPQDDIVHPELNVGEALRYYAKLRLASDMSNEEINILIDDTLNKLGIIGTKDTLIGSPETGKGISGGQRKRVNLAMELLAKPKVIFLDEPTSGLSAVDTKMVMELLRKLADEGTTIIITIHQPSFDNYKIMDNQIILSYGKLAYYGPTYPNSIEYFNKNSDNTEVLNNPDNALIGLHQQEEQQGELKLDARKERNKKGLYWKANYEKSKEFKEYVKGREGKKKTLSTNTESVSGFKQWLVLTSRYLRIKLKDMGNTSILLGQAPIIAIMIVMLFSKSAYNDMPVTLLFVLAISAVWFGTINASREIVSEKPIFERERKVGIKIFPYIMSKFLVLSVLCLIQSIALVGVVELLPPFSLGFGESFIEILLLIFLTSLSGLSIGLLVSTLAKSQAQALGLIPLVLLPMIIFGGGMLTVKQMNESGSSKIAFYMSQATPTKWALEEMTRIYVTETDEEKYCKNSENVWTQSNNEFKGKTCSEAYDQKSPQEKPLYERCQIVFDKCMEQRNFHKFNYGDSSSKSSLIYIILSFFILFPLIIVMIILSRRYKV